MRSHSLVRSAGLRSVLCRPHTGVSLTCSVCLCNAFPRPTSSRGIGAVVSGAEAEVSVSHSPIVLIVRRRCGRRSSWIQLARPALRLACQGHCRVVATAQTRSALWFQRVQRLRFVRFAHSSLGFEAHSSHADGLLTPGRLGVLVHQAFAGWAQEVELN